MSPSNKAYNEVKALLGKLDRSIDDARKRRLDTTPRGSTPPASNPPISTPPATLLGNGAAKAAPSGQASRQSSIFGRAQPLRPSGN
ncbi:MAG TPA: hypothetical protein VK176_06745 [Phycisphaerales bacterium]|nr:hypothetical protein [Phycisphaerales bacterium]